MTTLEQLEKRLSELEKRIPWKAEPTTPKPRCDAQGRLLELPPEGVPHYWVRSDGVRTTPTQNIESDSSMLAQGHLFISKPAAEAELTRLKCLQRLRGMEGFSPLGGKPIYIKHEDTEFIILDGFCTWEEYKDANATITPEERAAFMYREPMGEK